MASNAVQLPKLAWSLITSAAGLMAACVVAFMSWLAVTTIDQGKILSRIDAEVQSLKRHLQATSEETKQPADQG